MKNTPTPYEVVDETTIKATNNFWIAETCWKMIYGKTDIIEPTRQEKANAEFIVHAVNMHEYLVESLKSAIMVLESKKINCDLLRQTLSQAERK